MCFFRSKPIQPSMPTDQTGYHAAIISEIRMLLDFCTGSPAQTLKDLVIPDPVAAPPVGDAGPVLIRNAEVLNRLNDLELKVAGGANLNSTERTFLQLLRDALGGMVRPASGLTIAYTAMVVGNQRAPYGQSRAMRAQQAYANLVGPAHRHRWAQRVLLVLALCFTITAVWESARVALGRSVLQSVQTLHARQIAISQEMTKLLEAGRQSGAPQGPTVTIGDFKFANTPVLRLCDRPRVLAWRMHAESIDSFRMDNTHEATLFETPAQQEICDRDTILAAEFRIAHDGLIRFQSDWVSMISPGESLPRRFTSFVYCRFTGLKNGGCAATPTVSAAPVVITTDNVSDVDFTIAPVLLVLGNYVLPIIFALLGATVYVILDFYSKIRDSLLAPRDAVLSWIRLVLGMVLGACVGLFFSGTNPAAVPAGAGLVDSITLSASGLAFIAGFGVEGVFGLLDSLVRRIFSGDQDKGGRLLPG